LDLVIIPPSSNPLADFPPDTHFDFTAIVPLQLQTILSEAPTKIDILNRMKAILVGGAPVSLALQKQLQSITAPIYHTYGMTETVSHIALRRLNGPNATDRFSPFEGVDLALDERGCLTITAPVTQGETLHTNDLVDLQPDGSFIWLGRVDNVINSGGVKVQLEKVERAIEAFLVEYQQGQYAGRRFLVGALPDERLGQALVAVVEGAPLTEAATNDWEPSLWDERRTTNGNGVFENTVVAHEQRFETALRTDLSRILSRYEVPRQIFFLESLLETPTGKTDRLANLDRLQTILQSRPV
jgi:O-succinylbenzoic acid--CoA ligase